MDVSAVSLFGVFGSGLSIGFIIGYHMTKKTVVIDREARCTTPGTKPGNPKAAIIRKIYANGVCSDVTCNYIGDRHECSVTGSRCKLLT